MPFVKTEGATAIGLYNPTQYLDDNGNPGWSILVSNMNGATLDIDTGGYQWYAHSNGLNGSPIHINKWVTCRVTLLYSNVLSDYVYAVSQF